jgi:hypothetical protein
MKQAKLVKLQVHPDGMKKEIFEGRIDKLPEVGKSLVMLCGEHLDLTSECVDIGCIASVEKIGEFKYLINTNDEVFRLEVL